ncbi:MAG: flagellar biosynthetic protein FliO [bacterium]
MGPELLLLLTAPGGPVDATHVAAPTLPSYGSLLLKTILALILVIALAWIFLRWGLRRLIPGSRPSPDMRVIARMPVDGRRSLLVVEAYGHYLLLGVTEGGITLLRELTAEEIAAAERKRATAPGKSFAEVLREKLRPTAAPPEPLVPLPREPPQPEPRDKEEGDG